MSDDNITRVIRVQIDASQAYAQTQKFEQNIGKMTSSLKSLQDGFETIAKGWAIFKASTLGWEGIKGIVEANDQLKQLTATFGILMGPLQNSTAMVQDLVGISTQLGIKLDDAGKVAQRFAVALGPVGASNAQVAQLTENILMLGRIGGASMADVTEGARQLGQAFASGKLQGDELRSIMERIPLVGQKIAETMNVATGALYKLGADGKITTDILFKALLSGSEEIAANFAKMPFTFEQSVNRMSTVWTVFLAEFDKTSGLGVALTTVFVYIGSIISYITDQLKSSNEEMNAWQIVARGLGDAFKGIIIVIAAIGTAVANIATGIFALGQALYKIATGDFGDVARVIKEGMADINKQGQGFNQFANDLALGTTSIGKSTKEVRDYMTGFDEVLKKLHDQMGKTGKKAKETTSELEKFKKQLLDMFTAAGNVPAKLELIQKAMDKVNLSTEAGVKLYKDFQKIQDDLKPPTAVVTAFRAIDKAIDETADNQTVLFELQNKLMELKDVGAEGTETWIKYKEAYDELNEKLDKTGVVKAINDIHKLIEEGKNLQLQFDAINQAVEDGTIPEAWAENWKNAALGVQAAAKKTKDDLDSLATQFGKASKKFTADFADKLVDSLGEASFAIDDFANDFLKSIAKIMVNAAFQNFIKTMAKLGSQQGGWVGDFSNAIIGKSAKGNAWLANGLQFFAKGGLLNTPTFFNNQGRLAVAGEAGPEAVVPLQRTAGGDLGVSASPVNITINNNAAGTTEVKATSSDNADGSKQVTIFVEQKVRAMFSSGSMDRTMQSSYGLTRQPR